MAARRALITGASSGIGAAAARLLAAEGYRLALLARRPGPLAELAASLPGEGHVQLCCDLCDPAAIAAAASDLAASFDALDLVVCNAGIGYRARVEELEDDQLSRVFETNAIAPLRLARELLPLLRQGKDPVWVNVSSVVGRRGIPGQAAYSATKAALGSIGEALRLEWAEEGPGGPGTGEGIAVCTLEPALTTTGFFEAQPNPGGLPDPDLTGAAGPDEVADEILALDMEPRPTRSLRWKWWLLGALTPIFPRLSDRMLAKRLGGGWRAPRR